MSISLFSYYKSTVHTDSLIEQCYRIHQMCVEKDKVNNVFFIDEKYSYHLPWFYYATLENEMVGFISVYVLDECDAQICCFVLPEYRNNHIASKLFADFRSDYQGFSVHIAVPPENVSGKDVLEVLGFHYESTQCCMMISKDAFVEESIPGSSNGDVPIFDISSEKILNESHILDLGKNVISDLCIQRDIFPDHAEYSLLLGKHSIGFCNVSFSNDTACIYDVKIIFDYRNKGYGYSLVYDVLKNTFKQYKKVILHVSRENHPAFNLYKKLGFSTIEEMNYYSS